MIGNFRICLSEKLFPGALTENYWTGHINPELTTCTTGCQDEVSLASNGAHYNTTVYTDHEVKYNNGKFCAIFWNPGIDDAGCGGTIRYACEFTCQKERKYIL